MSRNSLYSLKERKDRNQKSTMLNNKLKEKLLENGIIIAFCLLFIFFSVISPYFLTKDNIFNVMRQISMLAIVSIGMTFVIISSCIDLSVGSTMGIAGILIANSLQSGFPLIVSILYSLGIALLIGFINGYLVASQKLPSFIVTLGMLTALRALCLIFTGGYPIYISSEAFQIIGRGNFWTIPVPIIIMIIFIFISYFLLNNTKFGRHIFIIGGNETAAARFGVDVSKVRIAVFMFGALAAGISGIIVASRLASGAPTAGTGFELNAIAAVALGGASLFGGEGSIKGTIFGVLIVGILSNGMTLMDVSAYYQELAKGLIIIFAVWMNTARIRNRA